MKKRKRVTLREWGYILSCSHQTAKDYIEEFNEKDGKYDSTDIVSVFRFYQYFLHRNK